MAFGKKKKPYSKMTDEEIKAIVDSFFRVSTLHKLDLNNPHEKELFDYMSAKIREINADENIEFVATRAAKEFMKLEFEKRNTPDDNTSEEKTCDTPEETIMENTETVTPKKKINFKKIGKFCLKFVLPAAGGFGAGFVTASLVGGKKPAKKAAAKPAAPVAAKPATKK